MTDDFTPFDELTGPGETASNVAELARLFPDAVVDGAVDFDVLRDLLGEEAESNGTEGFGLRWPGMAAARRLSTLPATMTLLPKPDESVDWENTRNIVIEGDNLEVLRLLRRAYTNSVDVIYIDPPYNTGNDFVYDDKRFATHSDHETEAGLRDDEGVLQAGAGSDRAAERKIGASRHSKWLSMVYPRLLVAHHLLKESGVIIVAIDDTEHARLKLLLDRVFGAENFISNVVWQGGRKNDSRYVSNGADYMLIYAKSEGALAAAGIRWREPKVGLPEAKKKAADIWAAHQSSPVAAAEAWRSWLKEQKASGKITDSVARFDQLHTLSGRPINTYGNITWPGAGGPVFDVMHPKTGKPVKKPTTGWRFNEVEMARRIEAGLIWFGTDETTIPRGISYLDEMENQVAISVFEQDRKAASTAMRKLFDDEIPFENPKDHRVLARWIGLVAAGRKDVTVLDFFAGSGSTGHAVMDLNKADDGQRRYILVQLDEQIGRNGFKTIADVTRERLRRTGQQISGQRGLDTTWLDTGFRAYRLATSNVKPWDGSGELNLLAAVDNLKAGRTSDDLLVEMMLRLGIDLVTPVSIQVVAGSSLYSLAGTLYAFFGTDITLKAADEIAKAIVAWRDEVSVDSDVTVVVRDTGFKDSSSKLNLAAALQQAGIKTLRSI
ncbi:Type III DNA modification methyltransferase [Rhodococcus sp. AW25M09]|uniref:site-specific DNA-methyltransferase n=1 Tax=Rhodococcus sp. AW25M09 TaxID=1268303 RepID=UPI0002AC2D94|nr:site-specific DNA-methyltransferase [Rhodococcus sp. AW25M09]CCQ15628.1 Type III DNA modification methyltransferase [Rhodococcus sp. AW25M09]